MASASVENVKKALAAVPLKDVTTVHNAPSQVVCLKSTNTLEYALSILAANNILSAPVFEDNGNCLGILDCLDIVGAVMKKMDQAEDAKARNAKGIREGSNAMEYVARPASYWLKMAGKLALDITQTHDVLDIKERDPYMTLNDADAPTLLDISKQFLAGTHRAAVLDADGRIGRIVSQSAVIAHLAQHPELMGERGTATLQSAGLAPPVKVVKVPAHLATLDAFHLLTKHNISGVAVIDDEGRLIGVLESSDLKRLTAASIQDLTLPILEYLKSRRRGVKSADWAFSAKLDDTVAQTLENFRTHHVHRLFVTGAGSKPVGIVSLSDIISFLLDEPRTFPGAPSA